MSKTVENILNEQGKPNISNCIDILKRTSIAVISLLESNEENEFVDGLEYTAESLAKHHSLEEGIMTDYRTAMQIARQEDVPKVEVNCSEAEMVRQAIFEMCDTLKNPKEIMRHVRTAFDVIAMWEPCTVN